MLPVTNTLAYSVRDKDKRWIVMKPSVSYQNFVSSSKTVRRNKLERSSLEIRASLIFVKRALASLKHFKPNQVFINKARLPPEVPH